MGTAQEITSSISQQLPWQAELYKHFHRHPELGLAEHETSARICEELEDLGYETCLIGGTGIVGILRNGEGCNNSVVCLHTNSPHRLQPNSGHRRHAASAHR